MGSRRRDTHAVRNTRPNEIIAKLSPTGSICIFTLTDAHLIADVVGYIG